jgi:hypothetical protein
MSQHWFNTVSWGHPVRVTMGWDRPLQYYFLTVQALNAEDAALRGEDEEDEAGFLYTNLDDPLVPDVDHQLAYFQRQLNLLGIDLPRTMLLNLERDRRSNVGNKVTVYQENGEFTIISEEARN